MQPDNSKRLAQIALTLIIGIIVGGIIVKFLISYKGSSNSLTSLPHEIPDAARPDNTIVQPLPEACPVGTKRVNVSVEKGEHSTYCESVAGRKEGKQLILWPNGKKKSESNYKDGLNEGPYIAWYENGKIQSEAQYRRGKYNGKLVAYWPNGNKREETSAEDDLRQGNWISWYENGQKMEEGFYEENQRTGEWKGYFENGLLRYVGHYDHGVEVGQWITYNKNGQKSEEAVLPSRSSEESDSSSKGAKP